MIDLIQFLVFLCVATIVYILVPIIKNVIGVIGEKRTKKMSSRAELYLQDEELQTAVRLTVGAPILLGAMGALFFSDQLRILGLLLGLVLGVILPKMYLNGMISSRKAKFNDQLVDSLMIMSSSFRGGLSLIQAIEAVVDEMPNPTKREFGIVLGENKMGVSLDDSLNRLYARMPSVAMQQMITAVLLARETGGNLPVIFSRIINTIRERKKIEQSLDALTIQGKIQAVVMSGLPVMFVVGVSASNPKFFDVMFKLEQGHQLLVLCGVLWVFGAVAIWKISSFKDF